MDNKESSQAAEIPEVVKASRKGPKKPPRVEPVAFLATWREVLVSEKDPVPKLRLMARAGFLGDVNGGHVAELVTPLFEHRTVAERLALRLAVQERFAKLNPLARRLLAELRTSFEKEIRYEAQEFSGYRAPRAIEDWVVEHAPTAPAAERDSWFRRFTVCLAKDSEPRTAIVGLIAAARRWASSKGLKSSAEDAAFIRGIAAALTPPAIGANKLELILAGVAAVDEQFRKALNRELDLERQIRTQQDSIDGLKKRVAALESDATKAVAERDRKAADITELEKSLTAAQERYDLLDRHWRGVSEQELTKQSGTFKERVSQEVVEALLALDRESPNLEIALRRLRRIQDILSK